MTPSPAPATPRAASSQAAPASACFISARSATCRSSPASIVIFAPLETADYVVCSGLFDDTIETPETYRDMLAAMRARSLFMVCANPDIVVERGDTLVYCAGALADAYVALGGEVLYCGKPHPPIYRDRAGRGRARRAAAPRCRSSACWRSAIRCARI